ncbi:uncharacterized protein B0J16DRAFT_383739 [Fusarium flagelliforme]|uniref:uncharacterized protein n=1 Tax=Fusarium flagelliforme TaxID=2675880 RepID=UPI001E8D3B41|nr:uncharacterized protein B0J16DRAFT_383739 [Fusarium flagelliforme]KAH7184686.1 hypothetical protein B0J16DRAFT_383739 [Fusarium flagelliforme]
MRSDNNTDYESTKSSRQSHQSNASGTSFHHQQNMQNAISDDFSAGFPGDFHIGYDHLENEIPLMTSHEDPLALLSTMPGWQDSLAFDPATGWQDPMACDSTMDGWQDLLAFDAIMGARQDPSTDSSRASSVSANSRPSAKDDGTHTQESFICNDECCQGRAFSSRANLRRHENERKGLRRVYACSFCHRVFSRSTAVRLHQQNGVCFKSNGATQ